MRRVEETAVLVEETQRDSAKAAAPQVMSNKDVLDPVRAKLPAEVVISKIKIATCGFDTSTTGLIQLKEGGVPDAVTVAMLECQKR